MKYNKDIDFFTNQLINKVDNSLEKFNYNVIIANFHETYNFLKKNFVSFTQSKNFIENYTKILILMLPVTPHLANECLNDLNHNKELKWPVVNKDYLKKGEINIVVQINGKKRALMTLQKEVEEKMLLSKIIEMKELKNYLDKKKIIKHIYVKNRLINLIVK